MPTTYTDPLGIAKQATGENSNTWGTIHNASTLELFKEAIAGMVTINLALSSGDYTLTTTNGVTNEARNAIIKFTGTLTANRNIVLPGTSKLYVFHNATSGAYTVTAKIGAGATVELSQGKVLFVYTDGTDVVLVTAELTADDLEEIFSTLVDTTMATGDLLPFLDVSDSNNLKIGAVSDIIDLVPPGIPSGTILDYAGPTEPSGYLLCYGQAVNRATYAALFAAIGTTWGTGDGSTTFNVPDFRGRGTVGKDNMGGTSADRLTNQTGGIDGNTLGAVGGAETHILTTAQMPTHHHSLWSYNGTGGETFAGLLYPNVYIIAGGGSVSGQGYDEYNATGTTSWVSDTGSSSAHNNVQPSGVVNKIIKT